jgi:hypothetical protein
MICILLTAGANDGFFNGSTSPFTTPILHPDGAFFCLLFVFSWVFFVTLWAWNHKPPPRQREPRIGDKQRPRHWEIPRENSDNWKNN